MSLRKVNFVEGEFYHIYNRGVEKRPIVENIYDSQRFIQSVREFNVCEPIGSIYENSFVETDSKNVSPLVAIVAYCLNPNHYHFLLTPLVENGVQNFMQRLGTGYTMYFNEKYKRSGSLFQGPFKAVHVDSNEYLLHVSAYVNLNNKSHQLGGEASKLVRSSWEEYSRPERMHADKKICKTDIILDQFKSPKNYVGFALSSLKDIIMRKEQEKELQDSLFD